MSDQGEDLIGFTWVGGDGLTYTVEQYWPFAPGYMRVRIDPNDNTVIRPIHAIRQRMSADTTR